MSIQSGMRVASCLLLIVLAGHGQRAYITDSFEITMRSEPNPKARILAMPKSGTPVEVQREESGWSLVQMGSKEGWVLSRYLMQRPSFEAQVGRLSTQAEKLQQQLQATREEFREASGEGGRLSAALDSAQEALASITTRYEELRAGASQFVELKVSYDSTTAALLQLREDYDQLQTRYKVAEGSNRQSWLITGAVILGGGLLLGFLFGTREKKRKLKYY